MSGLASVAKNSDEAMTIGSLLERMETSTQCVNKKFKLSMESLEDLAGSSSK